MATQAELDRIKAQLAAAEESVRIGERSVTYRSVEEMKKQKQLIEAELAASAGTLPTRMRNVVSTKGW